MKYRRPYGNDFKQIVELQDRHLFSVLSESEQSNGFFYGSFTEEQFKAMDNDLGIIVGINENGNIASFICASTIDFNKQFPLRAAMINRFPYFSYKDKILTSYHSFIIGPVCIDKNFRGKEIVSELYGRILELLPIGYELAVSIIAINTPRSLAASKKYGGEPVGQFEFDGKNFWVVVRSV